VCLFTIALSVLPPHRSRELINLDTLLEANSNGQRQRGCHTVRACLVATQITIGLIHSYVAGLLNKHAQYGNPIVRISILILSTWNTTFERSNGSESLTYVKRGMCWLMTEVSVVWQPIASIRIFEFQRRPPHCACLISPPTFHHRIPMVQGS
jgi:hypothetical protein